MTTGKLAPLVLVFGVFGGLALFAQPPALDPARKLQLEYTIAHYTKYDYRIPMRDGIKLFTSVYVPKDSSQPSTLSHHAGTHAVFGRSLWNR